MSRHLSTLTLHHLRYGELSEEAQTRAQAHLAGCDRCAERLAVQLRQREAFVLEPMPPGLRGATRRRRWPWWVPVLPALVAVGAAVLLFARPGGDEIRFRGEQPKVEVWVDVGDGARAYRDGEALGVGDRVQLKYSPGDAHHAALAGRDGTGEIEVYGVFAAPDGDLVDAPFALSLDDDPAPQELFVILADQPLDPATVRDVVAGLPSTPPGIEVLRTTVTKEIAD